MRANYEITAAIFAGLVLGAIAMPVVSAGSAYADDIVRVRGTIASVDGSTYVVKTRDGAEQKVALAPNAQVAGLVKASLAEPGCILSTAEGAHDEMIRQSDV